MTNEKGVKPEKDESTGAAKYVAAECSACSRRFKLRGWREGIKCPKCDGGDLMPTVAEGGAVDYFIADRSKGYARPDIRFAQWAKWSELITPHQYEMAFRRQNKGLQNGEPPRPIHSIMLEEGWLTQKQATALLEFMCRTRPDQDDSSFAEAALQTGIAGAEDVEKAGQLQDQIADKASETPALCQIMLEKQIINESQLLPLLKNLRRKGLGPLARLDETLKKPAGAIPSGEGLKQGIARNKQLIKQGAVIFVLLLAAFGIWRWQTRVPGYRFPAICEECGETSVLAWPEPARFPVRCPACRRESAYWRYRCDNGHDFPHDPFSARDPRCPVCDSEDVKALKLEDLD